MREFKPETIELLTSHGFEKLSDKHYVRHSDSDESDDLEVFIIGNEVCFERVSTVNEDFLETFILDK